MRAASASERDLGQGQVKLNVENRVIPEKIVLRTGDLHCLHDIAQAIRVTHNFAIFENPM
jgi:hypothetical protein